jgi:hypothetical protein
VLIEGNVNIAIGRHLQRDVSVRHLIVGSERARHRNMKNIALSKRRNIRIRVTKLARTILFLRASRAVFAQISGINWVAEVTVTLAISPSIHPGCAHLFGQQESLLYVPGSK